MRVYDRVMASKTAREVGTLARWSDDRGFGFITATGKPDVFVHISAFAPGAQRPRIGDRLEFIRETTPEGKERAVGVVSDRPATSKQSKRSLRLAAYIVVAAFVLFYVFIATTWELPLFVPVLYVSASIVTFAAYAVDKSAATSGGWRIAEPSLLALGLIGGWPGGLLAQELLRHKTRKMSFRAVFWVTVMANIIVFAVFTTPVLSWISDWAIETYV